MENQTTNFNKIATHGLANSPKKGGFSSGSDEEWSSCCGESIPQTPPGKSPSISIPLRKENVYSQGQSNLIQRHDISSKEIKPGKDTAVGSIFQKFSVSPVDKNSNYSKCHDAEGSTDLMGKISRFSEGYSKTELTVDYDAEYSPHGLRKISYQKAMNVPGILLEKSSFTQIEDCDALSEEALSSQKFNQSLSSDSPISSSSIQMKNPSGSLVPTLQPHDNSNGINISRSISFNDKMLETPRRAPELQKCSSVENSNYSIDPPSLQSSKSNRLLQSTPGRLQIISKSSSPSSPERESFPTSLSSSAKEKSSIKNLASSFTRRISFRKLKSSRKQKEDTFNFNTANGILPTEKAIASYEGLLRLFECPGCHNFMTPPLLQCRKGHLVCEKCKISFKGTCPVCKQRVTDTTNYMMEQVCQLVRFPCRFGRYGCPEYHLPKHKTDHEHFCIFRPVNCHYEASGCDCVLPLKEMNLHIGSCKFKYKGKNL